MSNQEASEVLAKAIESQDHEAIMELPLRSDCSEYKIEDLAPDQKESLANVLQAVRCYCEGHDVHADKVLRLTVSGVAGSGKSTWINTLVTSLRKMFYADDTVSVFAPTGAAAYNAGGQTLHKGFRVPIPLVNLEISNSSVKFLKSRFGKTLVIVIDERSMVDATMLGLIKHYMQECAHKGANKSHPWGGIPIIILVGDDYQLPPITAGAFYALHPEQLEKSIKTSSAAHAMRSNGFAEFLKIGKTVVYLEGEKRVNEGQDPFKRILRAVRCEDDVGAMIEEDVETLLELDLSDKTFTEQQRRDIGEEATYVFANREPRDTLNSLKLKTANLRNNPVARIKSKTIGRSGRLVTSMQSHFDLDRQPNRVLICKDARVTLNGYNPDPKNGLFHGSLGIVRDIVYNPGSAPNGDDFPAYVLVEFYQYCGLDLIPGMPQLVPVVAVEVRCKKGCCGRTYMPLALAYGKTAHTFQGQNVGPVSEGRPENMIKKIIVDPGKRAFEGQNVGLFYQLLSRATTIGNREDKMSSAIYFAGDNFSRKRFQNLAMKTEKEMYKKAALRKDWVDYLRQNEVPKGQWLAEEMDELFKWVNDTRIDSPQLENIIKSHQPLIQEPTGGTQLF